MYTYRTVRNYVEGTVAQNKEKIGKLPRFHYHTGSPHTAFIYEPKAFLFLPVGDGSWSRNNIYIGVKFGL